jgi:hypothetical protein
MHLVEAEDVGPIEGDQPVVTPPRPIHRRVSVSLLFTLTVLVGLVVTIYTVFPARRDEIMSEAVRQHRVTDQSWDLEAPTYAELRPWAIGVAGKGVPLPPESAKIVGARRVEVLRRAAALIRLEINGEPVTYLVQHNRGIAPGHVERTDGDVHAVAWRQNKFTSVAVGPQASAASWTSAVRR